MPVAVEWDKTPRDLAALVVAQVGSLRSTGDPWEPYRLVGRDGAQVGPVGAYLRDLQAAGRPATTQRSYAMALLRWLRFLWAVGVPWDQATRAEARDFSCWIQIAAKPMRAHWRRRGAVGVPEPVSGVTSARGTPNPVTGKPGPSRGYAPTTSAHSETVLRGFYDFHRDVGSGPMVNPFPPARGRRGGRAHAHHNPMEPHRDEKVGLYRPRVVVRAPRRIPDERFNELFARLACHRDRVGGRVGFAGDRTSTSGYSDQSSAEKRTWRRRIPGDGVWHIYAPVTFLVAAGGVNGKVYGTVHLVLARDAALAAGVPAHVLDAAAGKLSVPPQPPPATSEDIGQITTIDE